VQIETAFDRLAKADVGKAPDSARFFDVAARD
jgi:hypothetical protein